jgi:hypothetical protein
MKKQLLYSFLWSFIFINSGFSQTTQGLIGYWPFIGNASDLSGYINNGIVYNATLVSDRFGNPNSAYSFNGINSYIDFGNRIPAITNQITVSTWIKTPDPNSSVNYIVGKYGWNGSYIKGFHLLMANFIQFAGRDQIDVYNYITSGNLFLNDNRWHHLVGTINNSVYELWIDGIKVASNNNYHSNVDLSQGFNLYAGGHFNSGIDQNKHYKGIIDDIRLYNRALSSSEILQLFTEGSFSSTIYTINASANPANGGTITGDGSFLDEQSASLKATPSQNYAFVNWTEEANIVSTNSIYQFTVNKNRNLIANFRQSAITVTASSNPFIGGSITGTGVYTVDQQVKIIAKAYPGYKFLNWTESGSVVSSDTTYQFIASKDRNLVANFTNILYSISAYSNPATGGTIAGTGSYPYSQTVELVAKPASGFSFVNWTENGAIASSSMSYKFIVTKERTLAANFSQTQLAIVTSANPDNGGKTTGDGFYNYGETISVLATALDGYKFSNWTEGTTVVSTNEAYQFMVTASRNLTANFSKLQYNIVTSANPVSGGFTSGNGVYYHGASIIVVAKAGAGNRFNNWSEGTTIVSSNESYSFIVTSNRNLVANFSTIPSLKVTPDYIDVPSEAGTYSFNVENVTGGTMTWDVVSNTSWITIRSGAYGINNGKVFVTVLENPGPSRIGTATITSTGSINSPKTVEIRQQKFVSIEKEKSGKPTSYFLYQNFPNPFNPSTTIRFSLPFSDIVILKVFDTLGKEVAELVNRELSSGTYSISFDASNLNAGVYFYKISTGSFQQTRKLILMK